MVTCGGAHMTDGPEEPARILIVDDDENLRTLLKIALGREENYMLLEAGDGIEAKEILQRESVDVVITDLAMPRLDGEELMQWGRAYDAESLWIVLTGQATMAAAIDAVRAGAFDFVPKGPDTLHSLASRVRNAVQQRRDARERKALRAHIEEQNTRLRDQVEKLRDACHLLSQQNDMIQEDFCRAADIQRALLPREAPQLDGVAVDAVYRPCDRVGGDLYDVVKLDDDRLGVCVADAAGHGVAAAMLAVLFKSRLTPRDPDTAEPRPPADVLADINDQLVDECRTPRMFVSACYGIFDSRTSEFTVASAGHPPLLVHRHDGMIEQVEHSGPALGLSVGARFKQSVVHLDAGDRILLYTDGLYQAVHGRPCLTPQQVREMLQDEDRKGIALLQQLLRGATDAQKGRQHDDITLLLLSLSAVGSQVDNGQAANPHETSLAPETTDFELVFGRDDTTTIIRLQGQADWTYAASFHDACNCALAEGRALAVDLGPCPHLDSTFLGTIHELVTRADETHVPLALYHVQSPVRSCFEELGMQAVLRHVTAETPPLPECSETLQEALTDDASQQRVLRAHEALASLNDDNRRQFGKLIEYLRKEIEGNGHAHNEPQ